VDPIILYYGLGDYDLHEEDNRIILHFSSPYLAGVEKEIGLQEGTILHFYGYDEDDTGKPDYLIAHGVAHFDDRFGHWVALVDRDSLKHVSEVASDPNHWASRIDWTSV
jgi:hypothetical protein